jgi:hypothetical protein
MSIVAAVRFKIKLYYKENPCLKKRLRKDFGGRQCFVEFAR